MFSKKNTPGEVQQASDNNSQQSKKDPNLLSPTYVSKTPPIPSYAQTQEQINLAGKVGKSHHNYFKQMDQHKAVQNFRPITKQELSKHKSADSAWLSLNGVVYDVTTYARFHPGGKLILQGCGKQCIDLFSKKIIITDQYHPWVNGKYLLQKYKLGFLA